MIIHLEPIDFVKIKFGLLKFQSSQLSPIGLPNLIFHQLNP